MSLLTVSIQIYAQAPKKISPKGDMPIPYSTCQTIDTWANEGYFSDATNGLTVKEIIESMGCGLSKNVIDKRHELRDECKRLSVRTTIDCSKDLLISKPTVDNPKNQKASSPDRVLDENKRFLENLRKDRESSSLVTAKIICATAYEEVRAACGKAIEAYRSEAKETERFYRESKLFLRVAEEFHEAFEAEVTKRSLPPPSTPIPALRPVQNIEDTAR